MLPRVRAVLPGATAGPAREGDPAGCFLVDTAAELAPHDPGATRRVRHTFDVLEEALIAALERARDRGQLAPGVDPSGQAGVLLALLQGLQIPRQGRPTSSGGRTARP